jgi:hypothetical protein
VQPVSYIRYEALPNRPDLAYDLQQARPVERAAQIGKGCIGHSNLLSNLSRSATQRSIDSSSPIAPAIQALKEEKEVRE